MREIKEEYLTGERALYGASDLKITECVFDEGESPLKECRNIEVTDCAFQYKYPLWYCENVKVDHCTWVEMSRSGVWYTNHMTVKDSILQAPKNFRRCKDLTIENTYFANAEETLWNCSDVRLSKIQARGNYFGFHGDGFVIDGLELDGNYAFDSAKNITIRNSRLISKDSFWSCENVLVENCTIVGEYLGWNSKNITFRNCTIESNQGLCYIEGLKLENCKLLHTDLCFELCSGIDATITTGIDSVKNPISGIIRAPKIGELILDPLRVKAENTTIDCPRIDKRTYESDRFREDLLHEV